MRGVLVGFGVQVEFDEFLVGKGCKLVDAHFVGLGGISIVFVHELDVLEEDDFPIGVLDGIPRIAVGLLPILVEFGVGVGGLEGDHGDGSEDKDKNCNNFLFHVCRIKYYDTIKNK